MPQASSTQQNTIIGTAAAGPSIDDIKNASSNKSMKGVRTFHADFAEAQSPTASTSIPAPVRPAAVVTKPLAAPTKKNPPLPPPPAPPKAPLKQAMPLSRPVPPPSAPKAPAATPPKPSSTPKAATSTAAPKPPQAQSAVPAAPKASATAPTHTATKSSQRKAPPVAISTPTKGNTAPATQKIASSPAPKPEKDMSGGFFVINKGFDDLHPENSLDQKLEQKTQELKTAQVSNSIPKTIEKPLSYKEAQDRFHGKASPATSAMPKPAAPRPIQPINQAATLPAQPRPVAQGAVSPTPKIAAPNTQGSSAIPKVAVEPLPKISVSLSPAPVTPQKKVPVTPLTKEDELQRALADTEAKIKDLDHQTERFDADQIPLRNRINKLSEEKRGIEDRLRPVVDQITTVTATITDIEQREAGTTVPEERHIIEEKRWKKEDERRILEKQKWDIQKQLEATTKQISDTEGEVARIEENKKSALAQIEKLKIEKKKKSIEIELERISHTKERLELEWIKQNDKKKELETKLAPVLKEEQSAEAQVKELGAKAEGMSTVAEERSVQEQRWKAEDMRRNAEKQRWELQKQLGEVNGEIEKLKPVYQAAMNKEESLQKDLAAL